MTLSFDALCEDPASIIDELATFVGYRLSLDDRNRFVGYIKVPESIGRFRTVSLDGFDAGDLARLSDFGYEI